MTALRGQRIYNDPEAGEPLTPRQAQIAALVARALTNREIASAIGYSVKTLEAQMTLIHKKTATWGNRVALALWWQQNGSEG